VNKTTLCVVFVLGLQACGDSPPTNSGTAGGEAGAAAGGAAGGVGGDSAGGAAGGSAGGTAGGAAGSTSGGAAGGAAGAGGQPCMDPDGLCLEQPASGFQLRIAGTDIQAGQDVEYCEVVKLPGGPNDLHYIKGFEVAMTTGSHHLIVSAATPGSPTEASLTPGQLVACPVSGANRLGNDFEAVTGSQHPYYRNDYPQGVGRVLHGGQLLVYDFHYLNTSTAVKKARIAVNFHTADANWVQRPIQGFGFYNVTINTPVGEMRSFKAECTFDRDVVVRKLVRHTHQWGTDFKVWHLGGPMDGQMIWETPDYENTDYVFPESITVPRGQGFRFQCDFHNTTDHPLRFGTLATDEMCILFGTWWVVNPGDPEVEQSCQLFTTDLDGVSRPQP
jgi:hypothetical protein